MGIEIIFADTNEEYLERLTHYIKEHFADNYKISICRDKKQLQNKLKAGKCDVLCFAPELYDSKMDFKQVLLPIVLFDEEEMIPYPDKFKYTLNKYTRISKLMAYIDESYEIAERNKPLIYGVFGPAGGVGTSTVAIATAIAYANSGRKTCYVNLEDINSTELFFEGKNSKVLGETQKPSQESYEAFLKQHIKQDLKSGVFYCMDVQEILENTNLSITELIEGIIDSEIATALVVDLGSSLSAIHKSVFEQADKLLLVTTDANYALYKLQAFVRDMPNEEKIEVVYNQSNSIVSEMQVPVAGRIDKLYAKHAVGVCEYIAQNHLIKVAGI